MTYQEKFKEFINKLNLLSTANISVDHFSSDGMKEYFYPEGFYINNHYYWWNITRYPTKRRYLQTHFELWFHSNNQCFNLNNGKISTGMLTKNKLFKGFKIIFNFYNGNIDTVTEVKSC